jgi:hypothetical protein
LGSDYKESMQRVIARLLLLFSLAGAFVPLAMQAAAAPPHSCCLRKAVHRCHEDASADRHEPLAAAPGCCHHNCSRAVTTSQSAHPEPSAASAFEPVRQNYESNLSPGVSASQIFSTQSTRAPPRPAIA